MKAQADRPKATSHGNSQIRVVTGGGCGRVLALEAICIRDYV